jgi:L-seryl-tRNA(Ser) seleniumtransferase
MNLQSLPSVEQLLQTKLALDLIDHYGRQLTLQAIRHTLNEVREHSSRTIHESMPNQERLLSRASDLLIQWTTPTLLPVINASGVILHTNLGRAPLSLAAIHSMEEVARGYSNLEFNLESGKRGSRLIHAETILQRLTGAEAAVVVNNNAAAILLLLTALGNKKRVIVSRSQMVEIGGGFRIPDVMKQSGAKLVEIGTTNRVHLADFQEELSKPTALVMHAHRSNFKLIGFTEEPEKKEIADLTHKYGVIFADDLGSGALLETEHYGLAHEPMVQESLAAGADLVCFSGDKLLGGPQAGIIIGRKELLERIKKHPLARAVRADKICLAALSATLLHYLKGEAEREIPVWRMISMQPETVKARTEAWVTSLKQGQVKASQSTVGGGSLPGESLPTFVLALTVKSTSKFMKELRQLSPSIIARAEGGQILFDPRTVLAEQDDIFLANLNNILQNQENQHNA